MHMVVETVGATLRHPREMRMHWSYNKDKDTLVRRCEGHDLRPNQITPELILWLDISGHVYG
jgi:hypothetical protein